MDVTRYRLDTPATERLIHFNNAGSSLSPLPVQRALLEYLQLEQSLGGYEAAELVAKPIARFYSAFAQLLHCSEDEIAWSENATLAWNFLLQAVPLRAGDCILTSQSEYAGNYLSLLHLSQRTGVQIRVVPNDSSGRLDLRKFEEAIDDRVKLIALTHVPSKCGVIHPASEVGQLARRHGIPYLLDACQSVGQIDLNVEEIGCDMLVGSGRKYLRGPRGTGFMYVRRSSLAKLEPAWVDMHSAQWLDTQQIRVRDDARRFESWERYVAGQIALGVAVDYALAIGMPAIQARVQALAAMLRQQLADIPGVVLHEAGSPLSGIVTFSKNNEAPAALQKRLQAAGINSSVGQAAKERLDFGMRGLGDINRASVHYYNTEEEVERFCQVVATA